MNTNESAVFENHEAFSSRWFKIAFIIMAANSLILAPISYFFPDSIWTYFSFLLPAAHLFVWIIVTSFRKTIDSPNSEEDEIYLKKEHYHIWKKLHPFGPQSRNGFAKVLFFLGSYDDGTNERLNRIKGRYGAYHRTSLKAFFMIPAIWILNMIALAITSTIKHGI